MWRHASRVPVRAASRCPVRQPRIDLRGHRGFLSPHVEHGLVIDIAICIIAAWVMSVVCQAIRQPLLIAYLLAGFAAGPNGFRWITSPDSIQTIADIGLILLLFMIGLEMDLKTMFN